MEHILEEQNKIGELTCKTRMVDDGEAANVDRSKPKEPKEKNGEMSGPSVVSGKRQGKKGLIKISREACHRNTCRSKAAASFIEISPSNWTITTKLLGAGSYGCCYHVSYRGMDVVSKNLMIREVGKETRGQAENRVREELVYEALIMKKFGNHPGIL